MKKRLFGAALAVAAVAGALLPVTTANAAPAQAARPSGNLLELCGHIGNGNSSADRELIKDLVTYEHNYLIPYFNSHPGKSASKAPVVHQACAKVVVTGDEGRYTILVTLGFGHQGFYTSAKDRYYFNFGTVERA